MIDTLLRVLSSKVSWAQVLVLIFLWLSFKLFFYMRERHWKFPTFGEFLAPSGNFIELVRFIEVAISNGWRIGEATEETEDTEHDHPYKFDRILREAAIEEKIIFKGRPVTNSDWSEIMPLEIIKKEFWEAAGIDLFSYAEDIKNNNKTITYENDSQRSSGSKQYSDLHMNELQARKWLTTIASKHK